MNRKETIKKWHNYFTKSLERGISWNRIRLNLILRHKYKASLIEKLIYNYRIESALKQKKKQRLAIAVAASLLITMFMLPFFLKPSILGMVIGGPPVTYYVDAANGNDANNGLSPETAIKTITKVNSLTLNAGDSVLFKRGSRWNLLYETYIVERSGNTNRNITYGAYGEGPKPIFTRSIHANSTNNWTNLGNNLWETSFTVSDDIGLVVFDNENSWGIKQGDLSSLETQGDFFYDVASDKAYIYSVSNPALFYSQIELSKKGNIFDLNDASHIVIRDLDLRYSAKDAVFIIDSNYIYLINLTTRWIGGAYQQGTLRYGNALEILGNSSNIYILYNNIYQTYDAGVSHQIGYFNNIIYQYNIIDKARYCYEFFNHETYQIMSKTIFDHNTCYDSGGGFGGTSNGKGVRTGVMAGVMNEINITNNIFDSATQYLIEIQNSLNRDNTYLNNNLYYQSLTSTGGWYWKGSRYSYVSLDGYKTASEEDANSIKANPLFIDSAKGNFKPSAGSPACTMSSSGSHVGALPCEGEPVPPAPFCGDASCNGLENCSTCASDCGSCPVVPYCGDLTCDANENCSTCESDCGTCPEEQQPTPFCGDGSCNGLENCSSCSSDCGTCPIVPFCGDSSCNGLENCSTCASDCGACPIVTFCGDYSCNVDENCSSCSSDCGSCPLPEPFCGDLSCDSDENCSVCHADCGSCPIIPICGDGSCNGAENCSSCDLDCGSCPIIPACGDGSCNGAENCSTCNSDCGSCPEQQKPASTRPHSSGGGGGGSSILATKTNTVKNSSSNNLIGKAITWVKETVKKAEQNVQQEPGEQASEQEATVKELGLEAPAQIEIGSASKENPALFTSILILIIIGLVGIGVLFNSYYPTLKLALLSKKQDKQGKKAILASLSNENRVNKDSFLYQWLISTAQKEPETKDLSMSGLKNNNIDELAKLHKYVREAANRGYSRERVSNELLGVGWEHHLVGVLLLMHDSEFIPEEIPEPPFQSAENAQMRPQNPDTVNPDTVNYVSKWIEFEDIK